MINILEASPMLDGAKGCQIARFSVDLAGSVRIVRKIADDLEAGKLALSEISALTHLKNDDFAVQQVTVKFFEVETKND